jgi:hypothetical protein
VVQLKYAGATLKIGQILQQLIVSSPIACTQTRLCFSTTRSIIKKNQKPGLKILSILSSLLNQLPRSERESPWSMAENNGKAIASTNLHLLPELCRMSEMVEKMKKNNGLRQGLTTKLHKNSDQCVADIQQFICFNTSENVQKLLKDYHVQLNQELVTVEACQHSGISLGIRELKLAIQRTSFIHCLKQKEAKCQGALEN